MQRTSRFHLDEIYQNNNICSMRVLAKVNRLERARLHIDTILRRTFWFPIPFPIQILALEIDTNTRCLFTTHRPPLYMPMPWPQSFSDATSLASGHLSIFLTVHQSRPMQSSIECRNPLTASSFSKHRSLIPFFSFLQQPETYERTEYYDLANILPQRRHGQD
jgi:hypothetical protein